MFGYTNEGRKTTNGEINSSYLTNGLYSMEDDDGLSYYFRGNVDNIIQFGKYPKDYYVYRYIENSINYDYQTLSECQTKWGTANCTDSNKILKYEENTPMYWRIIRINGDGTLRLLYSGTSKEALEEDLVIGKSRYNSCLNEKCVGYTYDNITDSNIKREVDTWYSNSLLHSNYDEHIVEGKYCNDTNIYKQTQLYGFVTKSYETGNRLDNNIPTLKCAYTSQAYGGSYTLKVGLITADEIVLAGNLPSVVSNNYLSSGSTTYWTMSPVSYNTSLVYHIYKYDTSLSSSYNAVGFEDLGVRPVINVDVNNLSISGSGSKIDPYILSEK